MDKIKMTTPLVEMDGDEMTRILWKEIKGKAAAAICGPEHRVLRSGSPHRDETGDAVTTEAAAEANQKYGVGVKCATITPTKPA